MRKYKYLLGIIISCVLGGDYPPVLIISSQRVDEKVEICIDVRGTFLGLRLVNPVIESRIRKVGAYNASIEAPPEIRVVDFVPNSLLNLGVFTPGTDDTLRLVCFAILDNGDTDYFNLWPTLHYFESDPPGGVYSDTGQGKYEFQFEYSYCYWIRARRMHQNMTFFSLALKGLFAYDSSGLIVAQPGDSIIVVGGPYGWEPQTSLLRVPYTDPIVIEGIQPDLDFRFVGTLVLKRNKYYWAALKWARSDLPIIQEDSVITLYPNLPIDTSVDTVSPQPPTHFEVSSFSPIPNSIFISWNNPMNDFFRVVLCGSSTGYPNSPNSNRLYCGPSEKWIFVPTTANDTFYFSIWTCDPFGNYSVPIHTLYLPVAEEEKKENNNLGESFTSLNGEKLYDISGRRVKKIGKQGIYFVKDKSDKFFKKIVVVK